MRWAVVLVGVTLAIYLPIAWAPFVYEDRNWTQSISYDDSHGISQWPNRALTHWSYQLQAESQPLDPRRFHLVNVLLHLLTGGAVFALGRALSLPVASAGLASAIFLWHPLNVAAVSYVSARSDLLMTLCIVLAVALPLMQRWWAVVFVVPACLLAGMSKELGALSFLLVLWTWNRSWLRTLMFVAPVVALFVTWVEYGVWWPEWRTVAELASAQVMSLWRLLVLMVVPVGMSIDPDPWFWLWPHRMVGACALGIIAWIVWSEGTLLRRWALGWVAIVLLPRLVMPTYEPMHDQHAYLAMVAFAIVAGHFVKEQVWVCATSSPA